MCICAIVAGWRAQKVTATNNCSVVDLGGNQNASNNCSQTTVSYAFVVHGPSIIPMWPLWESYFSQCPNGSYTVTVHYQQYFGAKNMVLQERIRKFIHSVGGSFVSPECVVTGKLRYTFEMVRAMFALYRLSNRVRIPPRNCRPQWVHLLSSSCVPVRPCSEFHSWLSARPGVNRVTSGKFFNSRIVKSSQWSTIWLDDVLPMTADEDGFSQRWRWDSDSAFEIMKKKPQDEWVIPSALFSQHKQMSFNDSLPTFVDWTSRHTHTHETDGRKGKSHPFAARTRKNVKYLLKEARRNGAFFVRKILVGPWLEKCMNSSDTANLKCF